MLNVKSDCKEYKPFHFITTNNVCRYSGYSWVVILVSTNFLWNNLYLNKPVDVSISSILFKNEMKISHY